MPDYGSSLVGVIDARIAAYATRQAKMATVASRDGTGNRATVVFDGSSGTAQPVKCFESIRVVVGDRVGVIKYETEWIITANYSDTDLADVAANFTYGNTTTTSATFVDLPGSPTVSYVKARDTTQMEFDVGGSYFANVNPTTGSWGVRVTGPDVGVNFDIEVRPHVINAVSVHTYSGGVIRSAATMPAGSYTATGRWRRASGTGTLSTAIDDPYWIRCREVWP